MPFVPSDSARGAPDAEEQAERDARSIFIGNVDFATSVEEVQALFADCGEINAITIPVDKYTGRAKGFAYLEFASKVIAAARVDRVNEEAEVPLSGSRFGFDNCC